MKARLFLAVIAVGMSTQASGQQQRQQSLAIPAFFRLYTGTGNVNPDWVRILQAGSVAKIVVAGIDIGDTPGQGNVCTSSPAAMFDCLRANGQLVLGYVDTSNGYRKPLDQQSQDWPLTYVLHGGDFSPEGLLRQDFVDNWYNTYGGHIDGIFFDQGPIDPGGPPAMRQFYEALWSAMINRPFYSGSCGLAGTGGRACIMINGSQFAHDWVMTVTDYATMYEFAVRGASNANCCCYPNRGCSSCPGSPGCCCSQPGTCPQTYLDTRWFCPGVDAGTSLCAPPYQDLPGWYFTDQNALDRMAHVLFSATPGDIDPVISMSRGSYGRPGFLYIHDQNCAVYNRLPPYFEQLVTAVRAP
jgi:hypothetical protein